MPHDQCSMKYVYYGCIGVSECYGGLLFVICYPIMSELGIQN